MSNRPFYAVVLINNKDQSIKDLMIQHQNQIMEQMKFYRFYEDICNQIEDLKENYETAEKYFGNLFYDQCHYEIYLKNIFELKEEYNANCEDVFLYIFTKNSAGYWESLQIFLMDSTDNLIMPYFCDGNLFLPS